MSSSPFDLSALIQDDGFKAYMLSTFREAMASYDPTPKRDEQITTPVTTELFTPSETERERCPGIWPEDSRSFFRRAISDKDWNDDLRQFPKNTTISYDPPALPNIVQCSATFKSHDSQLSKIQCDIAHLTRPIDALVHRILAADDIPEDCVDLVVQFASSMRDRMEALASRISTVRLENLRKNKGLPASDQSNLLVDPHAFNDEIKTAKALAAAFAPPKTSQNNNGSRNKSGKKDPQQKQQQRKRQDKGNSDKRSENRTNSDQSEDESDRGRQQSRPFHKAKGKESRQSRSRGRSTNGRFNRQ